MEEWKEYKLGEVCSRLRSGKGIKADSASPMTIKSSPSFLRSKTLYLNNLQTSPLFFSGH